jgi:hypothetical protein
MAFKQSEYRFNDLPQNTLYTFAEMEINEALTILSQLHNSYQKATQQIEDILFTHEEKWQYAKAWDHTTNSAYFRRPQKERLINYFLYHQQSYKIIQKLTKASPNTISKFKFQQAPSYYPIFKHWDDDMLNRWNKIKPYLNIWKEDLVHSAINETEPEHYIKY